MTGLDFRDYHLLLDEHSDQIFAMTDDFAERARKLGATTLHSIGDIAKHRRLKDNNEEVVAPKDMLIELLGDNRHLTRYLRAAHKICDKYDDRVRAHGSDTAAMDTWGGVGGGVRSAGRLHARTSVGNTGGRKRYARPVPRKGGNACGEQ
jgi:DNA-binding ferritin-like protein